jgi:hypothetical protein
MSDDAARAGWMGAMGQGARIALVLGMAVAGLAMCPAAAQGDLTVGNTTVVIKTVTGTVSGTQRALVLQDDIYHNEFIETGFESATELTFLDQTRLTLGQDSRVVLDRFVFDPDPNQSSFVISIVRGVLRFVSGSLPTDKYEIHTPVSTIGIRGTVLDIAVADNGDTRITVYEGEVDAKGCGTVTRLTRPGETALLTRGDTDCVRVLQ